LNKLIYLKY